jgi:hypothetical protein
MLHQQHLLQEVGHGMPLPVLHLLLASSASPPATGLHMTVEDIMSPACLMASGVDQAASASQVS